MILGEEPEKPQINAAYRGIKGGELMVEEERDRIKKEYEDWENSLEGIHYCANIITHATDRGHEYEDVIITKVLYKLPQDVREDVIENVAFIVANCSFPVPAPSCKVLIVLYFSEQDDIERATTVAHEIAHYRLGNWSDPGGAEEEKRTDDLCESWGFGRAYESYNEFP